MVYAVILTEYTNRLVPVTYQYQPNCQYRWSTTLNFWGLLYGTDLNSLNLFCDVIFSPMRKICYTQYINYKKNKSGKVTWWWSGGAYIVIDGSVPMDFFYFLSCRMYELI